MPVSEAAHPLLPLRPLVGSALAGSPRLELFHLEVSEALLLHRRQALGALARLLHRRAALGALARLLHRRAALDSAQLRHPPLALALPASPRLLS